MSISEQLDRMSHDVVSGPSLMANIEIAAMGGSIGALLGYLRFRNRSGATSFALWGAGLGIGMQYLLYHMLKPALQQFSRTAQHAVATQAPAAQFSHWPSYGAQHHHPQGIPLDPRSH